jgi:glucan phosphoethanolaminetransferase (alkaline phosphatase superfamily)
MRTGWGFYGLVFIAGFVTFALHEGGHWLAAVLLGHEAYFGLNSAGARGPVEAADQMIISAAGPAVTVVQALVALWLIQARASAAAWVFLFWAAFMRFMATVISLFHPNDEARISEALGWGMWTLPVLVTLGLFALLAVGSVRLKAGWKTLVLTWVVASVAVSAVVGLDMVIPR